MACHAALAIQRAMGEYERKTWEEYGLTFKMRIGLNSGLVVGSIGDDLRMDYTAVGDTTSLGVTNGKQCPARAHPGIRAYLRPFKGLF